MPTKHCRLGGRFRRCPEAAEHSCQYCGASFCARHTYHAKDYEAVCTRKRCSAKLDDMKRHLLYRADVGRRNSVGLCGLEGCGPHPTEQCSLCEGQFCGDHVAQRMYPIRYGRVFIDRPTSVCAWCWARRKLWRR